MTAFVQRTCTEIRQREPREGSEGGSRSFDEFRETEAYVLLGAPGGGKTTEFCRQAELTDGCYVTARDFMTFDDRTEWHGATLFIDGLDEVRAGSGDGRSQLDTIRAKLDGLGCPRFRLSCRDADWFGANDREHLTSVSPDGNVTVLRLDPLSEENIREILRGFPGIEDDADEFVESARNRGVDGLLANPQTLKMMAEAVAGGDWPETRTQAFELFCRRALLTEHNLEHRIADADGADIATLMRVAGRLCAVQLLTGAEGWTTLGGESGPGFPSLDSVSGRDRYVLRQAVRSKLFSKSANSQASEGMWSRIAPVHRQTAEFLAAQYLAGLVRHGLPTGRILALITGHDGFVVSELRGLSAWLAAHSKRSRMEIIARDPLGTVLYGDVREFSKSEKQGVLEALEREANRNPWFVNAIRIDDRIGDIVTPDMEQILREILTDSLRDEARQCFVMMLVEVLGRGQPLPGLADVMMKILRDDEWWPAVKFRALHVFFRFQQDSEKATCELKSLAADVYAGYIPDPDDDLLGCLLSALYPIGISVTEAVKYLRTPKSALDLGEYRLFWTYTLPEKSSTAQLAEFLDAFTALSDQYSERQPTSYLSDVIPGVFLIPLRRYLQRFPNEVDPDRLFSWLRVAVRQEWKTFEDLGYRGEELINIGAWLSNRPETQKSLIKLGVERCLQAPKRNSEHGFGACMTEFERGLLGAKRPPDFASWCIDQALAARDRVVADYFIGTVARILKDSLCAEEISREEVERRITGNPELLAALLQQLGPYADREVESTSLPNRRGRSEKQPERQWSNRKRQRQRKWRDRLVPQEQALRANIGQPMLLHELAKACLGGYVDVAGESSRDRLRDLLGDEDHLVEAALEGLRGSIRRDDLPSHKEIIRLAVQNRTHYLALPYVAGLNEISQAGLASESCLDDSQVSLALAIHYSVPVWPRLLDQASRPPDWFPPLLQHQPEVVAGILVQAAGSHLRNGKDFSTNLYDLAHSEDHGAVARLAALPLLEALPVRGTERQLPSLLHLLLAARLHCKSEPFRRLTEKKLSSRSMNVGQRVYWLAAGLLTWQGPYVDELESYVAGNERRVRRLAEFITGTYRYSQASGQLLDVPATAALIRVIGVSCHPHSFNLDSREGGIVTWNEVAARRISDLIDALAAVPSATASQALAELVSEQSLGSWRSRLTNAAYRQNAIRREANFRHHDRKRVIAVLENGKPANAADLASLTLNHLREIGRTIQAGNTSDWRQYWNMESPTEPTTPKHEDLCRDALLSDLRFRLEVLGIDAQPEGRYADDKRSDIRVSFGGFNLPVEIKKSCHRELWSAVRTQLIAKYARDPDADGHGIYLVFWFGDTASCRPMPGEGAPPRSADELEQGLRGTLSAEEQLKVSICVIDVSMPAHASSLRNPIVQT